MVHEFGANEKTLEDIDLKAALNSNGKFSKSDVAAESATLTRQQSYNTALTSILETS